jgi:hypothetical protein
MTRHKIAILNRPKFTEDHWHSFLSDLKFQFHDYSTYKNPRKFCKFGYYIKQEENENTKHINIGYRV